MKSQLHLPTPLSTDSTDIVASPLLKAATLRIFLSRTLPDRPQHPLGYHARTVDGQGVPLRTLVASAQKVEVHLAEATVETV